MRDQEALRETEELYRTAIEGSNDGVAIVKGNEHFYVNGKFVEMFGYDHPAEVVGKPVAMMVHPHDKERVSDFNLRRQRGETVPSRYEFKGVRKDGEPIDLEVSATRTTFRGTPVSLVYFRDITERKRLEAELRRSEDLFSKIFLSSPAPVTITTLAEGRFVKVNEAFERMVGYSREELLGRSSVELGIWAHPDQRDRIMGLLGTERSVRNVEIETIGKSGEVKNVLYSAELIQIGDDPHVLALAIDITERHKMEEELLKSRKLESLGILAGGIAHDFNNILAAVMGNISLAKMHAGPDSAGYRFLADAEKASSRAKDLTQQLLTFSRGGAPLKAPASLADVIRESAAFALSGSNVRCEFFIPDDLWPVEADVGQIGQAISNLIINADHSMPDGGVVEVRAGNTAHESAWDLPLNPGKYVRVFIRDEGIGIPQEHLSKIFDPYFTTKQRGSGLGLSTAYSIIKRHGGHIEVESRLGAGTTFRVYLPASDKEVKRTSEVEEGPSPGEGKILVMDDDESVRDVVGRMLDHLGYTAETARDGAEAIEMYKKAMESSAPFRCVIMDLTIPGGMGGKETMERLLEIDPGVKAIVSSGYSSDPVMSHFREFGFGGVVAKPFRIQKLGKTLRNVLDGSEDES